MKTRAKLDDAREPRVKGIKGKSFKNRKPEGRDEEEKWPKREKTHCVCQ